MQELIKAGHVWNTAATEHVPSTLQTLLDKQKGRLALHAHTKSLESLLEPSSCIAALEEDLSSTPAEDIMHWNVSTVCTEAKARSGNFPRDNLQQGQLLQRSPALGSRKQRPGRSSDWPQQQKVAFGGSDNHNQGPLERRPQKNDLGSSHHRTVPVTAQAQKSFRVAFGRSTSRSQSPKRLGGHLQRSAKESPNPRGGHMQGSAKNDVTCLLRQTKVTDGSQLRHSAKNDGRYGLTRIPEAYSRHRVPETFIPSGALPTGVHRGDGGTCEGLETGATWKGSWQFKRGTAPDCRAKNCQAMACNRLGCDGESSYQNTAHKCKGSKQRQISVEERQLQGSCPHHLLCASQQQRAALDFSVATSTCTLAHCRCFLHADGSVVSTNELQTKAVCQSSQLRSQALKLCSGTGPNTRIGRSGNEESERAPQPLQVVSHYLPCGVCSIPADPQRMLLSDKDLRSVLLSTASVEQMRDSHMSSKMLSQESPGPCSADIDVLSCCKGHSMCTDGSNPWKGTEHIELLQDCAVPCNSTHIDLQKSSHSLWAPCVQADAHHAQCTVGDASESAPAVPKRQAPTRFTGHCAPEGAASSSKVCAAHADSRVSQRASSTASYSQRSHPSRLSTSCSKDADLRSAETHQHDDHDSSKNTTISNSCSQAAHGAHATMSDESGRTATVSHQQSCPMSSTLQLCYGSSTSLSCSPCCHRNITSELAGPQADQDDAFQMPPMQQSFEIASHDNGGIKADREGSACSPIMHPSRERVGHQLAGTEVRSALPFDGASLKFSDPLASGSEEHSEASCNGRHGQPQHEHLGLTISAVECRLRSAPAVAVSDGVENLPLSEQAGILALGADCNETVLFESVDANASYVQLRHEQSGLSTSAAGHKGQAMGLQKPCSPMTESSAHKALGRATLPGGACVQQSLGTDAAAEAGFVQDCAHHVPSQHPTAATEDGAQQLHAASCMSTLTDSAVQQSQEFPGLRPVVDKSLHWCHDDEDVVCTGLGTASPVLRQAVAADHDLAPAGWTKAVPIAHGAGP
jgi:hypothetical protein